MYKSQKFKRNTALILALLFSMLLAFPTAAQTNVLAGDVSGTWTLAGSPYLVGGDISVPAGETLTIEPGVVVNFQAVHALTVNGPSAGEVSGVTGSDGTVFLKTDKVRKPQGEWCFEVTSLVKDGYVYNPAANVVTVQCESN